MTTRPFAVRSPPLSAEEWGKVQEEEEQGRHEARELKPAGSLTRSRLMRWSAA